MLIAMKIREAEASRSRRFFVSLETGNCLIVAKIEINRVLPKASIQAILAPSSEGQSGAVTKKSVGFEYS